MAKPVKDITVQGLKFRDAADITMIPWGVPSGGDWGLFRGGAIFIEGAESITIDSNLLQRLDGNGVFVSGYTRNVTISNNEFAWIGCSAMAGWGYTKENDGTDGQQPRYTYLLNNYVHELGHFQKQSSMWFQVCSTLIISPFPNSVSHQLPNPWRNVLEGGWKGFFLAWIGIGLGGGKEGLGELPVLVLRAYLCDLGCHCLALRSCLFDFRPRLCRRSHQ